MTSLLSHYEILNLYGWSTAHLHFISHNRFYVDPSIALKNMPPQTPSGTSSTASTPNSDTPKPGPPAPSASVSRPSVPPSQVSLRERTIQGGVCLNFVKVPYLYMWSVLRHQMCLVFIWVAVQYMQLILWKESHMENRVSFLEWSKTEQDLCLSVRSVRAATLCNVLYWIEFV